MEAALLDLSRKVSRKAVPDTDIDALLNCDDAMQVISMAKKMLGESPNQADNLIIAFLGNLWLKYFVYSSRFSAVVCKAITEWNSLKRLKHTSNAIFALLLLCVESKGLGKCRVGLLSASTISRRIERYRGEIEALEPHKFMVKYVRLPTTNLTWMEMNAVYCWLKQPKRIHLLVQSLCTGTREVEITSVDEYELFTDCMFKTDGLWFAWYLLVLVCKQHRNKWGELDEMVSNYLLVTKVLWREEKDKHYFVGLLAELWNAAARLEMGKPLKEAKVDNVLAKINILEGKSKPVVVPKVRRGKQSHEKPPPLPAVSSKTTDLDYLMFFTHHQPPMEL